MASMACLKLAKCDPGFFYQVFDPEQPSGLPLPTNVYNYQFAAPSLYYNPALLHAAVPYTLKGCTNNLGLPVPCNIGGIPTIFPVAESADAPEPAVVEDPVMVDEPISSEDTVEKAAVIEARRKRDADPYYLGYGLAGYHPYSYGYGYGYYGGCRNYLGVLVPCA